MLICYWDEVILILLLQESQNNLKKLVTAKCAVTKIAILEVIYNETNKNIYNLKGSGKNKICV